MTLINKQRAKALALALLLLVLLALFLIQVPTLLVSEQQGGAILAIPMLFNDTFTYEYIHSVLKTPVQENFILAPGHDLILTSTTYQSLGVGTPFLPGEGKLENRNGLFVLKGQNRHFPQVNLVFLPLTKQALIYREKRYNFEDYTEPGSLIKLESTSCTLVEIFWFSTHRKEGNLERS
ncbi:MAG: DUF1850 domain-containing protein [Bacillota bacterium]